jgi:WD40 repeat protein
MKIFVCVLVVVASMLFLFTGSCGSLSAANQTGESGPEVAALPQGGHTNAINSVAFSPDGSQALSGSVDNTIKLWDTASGRLIRTFAGHTRIVNSVTFSPDGTRIISGSFDNTIKLWDTAAGSEIRTFTGHTGNVNSVAFSPDGRQILSGGGYGDNTIKLWDAAAGREIRTFTGHTHGVNSAAFSSDGGMVLSGSWDNTVRLWDTATGQEIRAFLGYAGWIYSATFSPDGGRFLSGSTDGTIKLWDAVTGKEIRTFAGHTGWVYSTAFSPDGGRFLSGSYDKTAKLWDVATGQEIRTFTGHTGWVWPVAFSPDGKQVLSGSDNTFKLWDAATGREIRIFSGHTGVVYSATFSPDGKQILSSSLDGTIKLWDAAAGREIRTFAGHTGGVWSAAFSPDGKQIISGSWDNTVKLWDAAAGREIRTFAGHTEWVRSVAFSPDGKQVLSGSYDNTIKLWDTVNGNEIRTFTGHTGWIQSAMFSPDGRQILSGSWDGTTRLWDAATGKEIASFISFSGADNQLTGGTRDIDVVVETAATSIDGEWVVITPDGYYAASPRGDRYINVRIGNAVTGIDSFRSVFYNPDIVLARLAGEKDPPSKATVTIQQAAAFMPPEVSLKPETRAASSSTARISVSITDKNLPVQNIIVMVNGRRLGADELAAVSGVSGLQPNRASLTVTGNQRTLNLTLPVNLDPGDNRIEVVAFNGYSENRRSIDLTWNALTEAKPALPDLWILAVGVNKYDNAGAGLGNLRDLNFCVADARGVIDSLKTQEGVRYGTVRSLLIADDAEVKPTAANIRQSLKFLEDAKPRDVVLLFLAGHGVSAQEGKFFFLPRDAAISSGKTVDPGSALSGDEIVSVLDAPGNRLVFIDACQSGGVDNDRMVRSLMDTNAFVFAACRGNESSVELRDLGHGVFTYSIMDALKGATRALAAGNVSVISLSGFVSMDVPQRTGNRQNPKAYSLGFYDFPMALIK